MTHDSNNNNSNNNNKRNSNSNNNNSHNNSRRVSQAAQGFRFVNSMSNAHFHHSPGTARFGPGSHYNFEPLSNSTAGDLSPNTRRSTLTNNGNSITNLRSPVLSPRSKQSHTHRHSSPRASSSSLLDYVQRFFGNSESHEEEGTRVVSRIPHQDHSSAHRSSTSPPQRPAVPPSKTISLLPLLHQLYVPRDIHEPAQGLSLNEIDPGFARILVMHEAEQQQQLMRLQRSETAIAAFRERMKNEPVQTNIPNLSSGLIQRVPYALPPTEALDADGNVCSPSYNDMLLSYVRSQGCDSSTDDSADVLESLGSLVMKGSTGEEQAIATVRDTTAISHAMAGSPGLALDQSRRAVGQMCLSEKPIFEQHFSYSARRTANTSLPPPPAERASVVHTNAEGVSGSAAVNSHVPVEDRHVYVLGDEVGLNKSTNHRRSPIGHHHSNHAKKSNESHHHHQHRSISKEMELQESDLENF